MRVHASSLREYEFCPRAVYLKNVLKIPPKRSVERCRGLLGHAIRKELSLRQSKLLGRVKDVKEIEPLMLEELNSILEDIPYIYRNMLAGIEPDEYVSEIKTQLTNEIRLMGENLSLMINELGIERALEIITPWRVEYSIRSDELKLSGRIDKIMKQDTYMPIEIKTGYVGNSTWEGDRLQICAYALLLEDKFDEFIPYGFVEYTQIQEKRPVLTTEKLRRKVINTRDEILEILNGKVPEICPHGSGKKCQACGFFEDCYNI